MVALPTEGDRSRRGQYGGSSSARLTDFDRVCSSIACWAHSRPKPDCLNPPNAVPGTVPNYRLTQTLPASTSAAARWATEGFSVAIPAVSP